jgi:type II secretory pathway component GspD/PulD (secretin)
MKPFRFAVPRVLAVACTLFLVAATSSPRALAAGPSLCRKLPAGKRIVKLSLKPETDLDDLIAWISSITCKQFVVPASVSAGRKVTIISPLPITPEEAYRLFLDALDSVGLAVYPSGKILRVIEASKARTSPLPVYGAGQSDQ